MVFVTSPDAPPVRLRPEIVATVPYRQGRQAPADAFKLSSNENPNPPHPAIIKAIAASTTNRYPDAAAVELRSKLAARHNVDLEAVHVGAGSVSILAQLIQAAAQPGDEVVYAWRSFEAYPGLVTVAGATSVQVPNRADHSHDLPAMAAAVTDHTRVIIVCSPNNPTGTVVSVDAFTRFMASVPPQVLVILDEAYSEFVTDGDAVRGPALIADYPNLVVLKTFSKAYGLAGLRIGYALGAPYILDAARNVAIPLSVTEPAQRAAIAALEHESEILEQVAELTDRREVIWEGLRAQGWAVPRSHGNFVWLPTGTETQRAADSFIDRGIVGRALGNDGIRISIGEPESVDKLLQAAQEVVRNLPSSDREPTLD
ncbi:MAG: aminotransferase class I/II-fold pyridoxal phosphate-dependent enzyme [Homoserinimonas sp.]|nr:aminotransferase class I/II-fold pyridoxal phosphate-dependent enzyme [Homoserinimonas sp.]